MTRMSKNQLTPRAHIQNTWLGLWMSRFFWLRLASGLVLSTQVAGQVPTTASSSASTGTTGATPVLMAGAATSAPRRFSSTATLSASSNLESPSVTEHQASMDFSLGPSYALNDTTSLGAGISISKDLTGEQDLSLLNDATVTVSRRLGKVVRGISASADITGVIPFSKESRQRDSLITSLTLRPSLSADLSEIGMRSVKLGYGMGLTRHVHEYGIATSGKSNAQYGLSQRLSVSWNPTERLGLMMMGQLSNAWTYQWNLKQSFRFVQEISFDVSDTFSLSIDHQNQGPAVKADGVTSNIALFNSHASTVSFSVSQTF